MISNELKFSLKTTGGILSVEVKFNLYSTNAEQRGISIDWYCSKKSGNEQWTTGIVFIVVTVHWWKWRFNWISIARCARAYRVAKKRSKTSQQESYYLRSSQRWEDQYSLIDLPDGLINKASKPMIYTFDE